jgi:adenine deaminase
MIADRHEAAPYPLRSTMNINWERVDLEIPSNGSKARVIGVVPDQLVTRSLVEQITSRDGQAVADPDRDILKIAVIERHRASGAVGKGFVKGVGLRRGALASSIAHDHHNLIVVGADDISMHTAAQRTAELGGGMVVADGESVLSEVPLPYGGLMSDQPIEHVRAQLDKALAAAHELGASLHDPFMAMSFLGLEVIPSLKLTDKGLVDVDRFETVPLWAD